MSYRILIILGLTALAACYACAKFNAQVQAQQFAESFFETFFSKPKPETQSQWGMSDVSVFGRGALLDFGVLAGGTEANSISGSPDTFEVVIPFWCMGKSFATGETLKFKRKLSFKVSRTSHQSNWQIQHYEFRGDEPLPFWRQLLAWIIMSFIGPLLLLTWVSSLLSNYPGCALTVTGILTLPFVGHVSFVLAQLARSF